MLHVILPMLIALPAAAASPAAAAPQAGGQCSAAALPGAQRQRMQAEYRRRLASDGKARADAWAAEQGRLFRQKLVDRGVCPPPASNAAARAKAPPKDKRTVRGKDGKPCSRTRLENRNIASLGGGPMQMVLVPVCAD